MLRAREVFRLLREAANETEKGGGHPILFDGAVDVDPLIDVTASRHSRELHRVGRMMRIAKLPPAKDADFKKLFVQ